MAPASQRNVEHPATARSEAAASITPAEEDLGLLDVCDEYIGLFDDELRMAECNSSLCSKALVDCSLSKHDLMRRSILEFMPDLEDIGLYEEVLRVHSGGGLVRIPEYRLSGINLNRDICCAVTISRVHGFLVVVGRDISEQRRLMELFANLENRVQEVENDRASLLVALDVLVNRLETKQHEIEENCRANMESIVMPLVDLLHATRLDDNQRDLMSALRESVHGIADELCRSLHLVANQMTPREIQIAKFIQMGKTSKEISQLLHLSAKTVDFHRTNIRKKMGIANTSQSLGACLAEDFRSDRRDSFDPSRPQQGRVCCSLREGL